MWSLLFLCPYVFLMMPLSPQLITKTNNFLLLTQFKVWSDTI